MQTKRISFVGPTCVLSSLYEVLKDNIINVVMTYQYCHMDTF